MGTVQQSPGSNAVRGFVCVCYSFNQSVMRDVMPIHYSFPDKLRTLIAVMILILSQRMVPQRHVMQGDQCDTYGSSRYLSHEKLLPDNPE